MTESNYTTLSPEALDLLTTLHRGGKIAYLWTKTVPATPTLFFKVGEIPTIPPTWKDVYFGVLPLASRKSNFQRGKITDVQSAGCLFAEFDAKDFPNNDKAACLAYVRSLTIPPTWIIDSGGGYHAYWILDNPVKLETEEQRTFHAKLQERWVNFVGGDPGAKDLARVLRLPGSLNYKYDPPRPVVVVKPDGPLYTLRELESAISPEEPPQDKETYQVPTGDRTDPGAYWLNKYLAAATIGNGDEKGFSLACELRDSGLSESVILGTLKLYADQVEQDSSHPFTSKDARRWLDSALTRSPREAATLPRAVAQVPVMITKKMRADLLASGFSEDEIKEMTPAQAWENLGGMPQIDQVPPEPEHAPEDYSQETTVKPQRYTVYDASEALLPIPPRIWLIDQIVLERSLNLWVGAFGSKKTWSMLSAAVCASLTKSWVGYDVPKPIKVLYIDQDMGEDYTREYMAQCIRGELGENDIAGKLSFISGANFDLFNPDDLNLLYLEIVKSGAELVFMDALRNFTPGRDENSVKDMQPALNALRHLISSTRAAIVISHHENKAGGWSGSTAIPGGVDCMLSIKSDENQPFIFFKTGKKRSGKPQDFAGHATWTDDGQQFYISAADMDALKPVDPKALDVKNYFEEEGDKSFSELQAFFDRIGKTTLYKIIDYWIDKHEIERKNPNAPRGQAAIYGLAWQGSL
jgi:hypothetical protein